MDAAAIVKFAEEVHASRDIDRMLECFDPEVSVYWNGKKVATGLAELRRFYEVFFTPLQDFTLKKTLRAATGNTIAVEWTHTKVDQYGNHFEGHAAEIWTMKNDRLVEWHAYCTEYPSEGK
jgi:nuclear transport factor 2 (NTF2) superfamily protein